MSKELTTIKRSVTVTSGNTSTTTVYMHLGSVKTSNGTHLAVVRQTSTWTDKVLVAVPTNNLCAFAYAYGNDAQQTLVNGLASTLGGASWSGSTTDPTRQKALFAWYTTCCDPGNYHDNGSGYNVNMDGCGQSALAERFNLRGLPLGHMSEWHAYVRLHCLSAIGVAATSYEDFYSSNPPDDGIDIGAISAHDAAHALEVYAFESVSDHATVGAAETNTAHESLSLIGKYNAGASGTSMSGDLVFDTECAEYLPFTASTAGHPLRVYRAKDGSGDPVHFFCDVELTGSVKSYILQHTRAPFWLAFRFARDAAGFYATVQSRTHFFYAQRVELVLKCTGSAYN